MVECPGYCIKALSKSYLHSVVNQSDREGWLMSLCSPSLYWTHLQERQKDPFVCGFSQACKNMFRCKSVISNKHNSEDSPWKTGKLQTPNSLIFSSLYPSCLKDAHKKQNTSSGKTKLKATTALPGFSKQIQISIVRSCFLWLLLRLALIFLKS